MDVIFGIGRMRFNRACGYWIVEQKKPGAAWDFITSSTDRAEAEATLNRFSIIQVEG